MTHPARSGRCDHTARFRPRYWIFVGPGTEKTRHRQVRSRQSERQLGGKSVAVLQTYKESRHSVVLGTTIFEQATLKQKDGKDHLHFNACPETVSCFLVLQRVSLPATHPCTL